MNILFFAPYITVQQISRELNSIHKNINLLAAEMTADKFSYSAL
jgi:hypothetical protein